MDAAAWVVIGVMFVTVVLLVIGAAEAERRWQRFHPPDDWDGCREDDQRDEDED